SHGPEPTPTSSASSLTSGGGGGGKSESQARTDLTPLESALTEKPGGGGKLLTRLRPLAHNVPTLKCASVQSSTSLSRLQRRVSRDVVTFRPADLQPLASSIARPVQSSTCFD